jgi:hypothetical protein
MGDGDERKTHRESANTKPISGLKGVVCVRPKKTTLSKSKQHTDTEQNEQSENYAAHVDMFP